MDLKRIGKIVELAERHSTYADIGTDHGLTSLMLLQQGKAERIIATDISRSSLGKAERLFVERGLSDKADFRIGDGLSVLKEGEAQGLIISGMGGELIIRMLGDDIGKARLMDQIILSPQSSIPEFRKGLMELGLNVATETAVNENGHFYPVFVIKGEGDPEGFTPEELITGRYDHIADRKTYLEYISFLASKTDRMLTYALSPSRREELERERDILRNFEHLLNREEI